MKRKKLLCSILILLLSLLIIIILIVSFSLQTSAKETTDFSQYVYTDEYDQVRFRYNGQGDKRIIIPEGVEIVEGMTEGYWDSFNYDVEYIYVPSSVKWICGEVAFECENDDNWYNVFYGCLNLKKIKVSKKNEDFKTNKKGTILYNYRGFKKGWRKRWQYNKRIIMGD